jgi:hypothetical protein
MDEMAVLEQKLELSVTPNLFGCCWLLHEGNGTYKFWANDNNKEQNVAFSLKKIKIEAIC